MPRRNRVPQTGPFPAWEQLWQIFCPWVTGTDDTVITRPDRRKRPPKPRQPGTWTLLALAAGALLVAGQAANAANPVSDQLVRISLQQKPQALHSRYPLLFGKAETQHDNLGPFTKWSGVLQRFADQLPNASRDKATRKWLSFLEGSRDLDRSGQIEAVNHYMNTFKFVADAENYKVSDYWATPMEFMRRGGDCEDYAIAKYVSLRALGFKEEELRIAIVYDTHLHMPHAVLIVYQNDAALVLDNQADDVKAVDTVKQYAPIYSINQYAWWRH